MTGSDEAIDVVGVAIEGEVEEEIAHRSEVDKLINDIEKQTDVLEAKKVEYAPVIDSQKRIIEHVMSANNAIAKIAGDTIDDLTRGINDLSKKVEYRWQNLAEVVARGDASMEFTVLYNLASRRQEQLTVQSLREMNDLSQAIGKFSRHIITNPGTVILVRSDSKPGSAKFGFLVGIVNGEPLKFNDSKTTQLLARIPTDIAFALQMDGSIDELSEIEVPADTLRYSDLNIKSKSNSADQLISTRTDMQKIEEAIAGLMDRLPEEKADITRGKFGLWLAAKRLGIHLKSSDESSAESRDIWKIALADKVAQVIVRAALDEATAEDKGTIADLKFALEALGSEEEGESSAVGRLVLEKLSTFTYSEAEEANRIAKAREMTPIILKYDWGIVSEDS